jgi:hypothetical protein
MKVLMAFLLFSFLLGARDAKREKPVRAIVMVAACIVVALALRTTRFV